jgi:hypothetical protein
MSEKIRCRVITSLRVRLKTGEVTTLAPGELVDLQASEATRLIRSGRIKLANPRVAVLVYSEVLQAHIWVVAGEKELEALRAQVTEPIYTGEEIQKLKKIPRPREALRSINEIKTLFPGSEVNDVQNKEIDNEEEG